MKTTFKIFLIFILTISSCFSQNHDFVHPGIPWTTNDLDQMKDNRNVFPWSEGWDEIITSNEASLDYRMQGPAVNVDRRDNNITNDGNAALYHALQWYFTGNSAHAEKSVSILEAWAGTHRTFSGNAVHLHAAWRGGTMVKAAEILRYTYSGWTNSNTDNLENYFQSVLWPQFRLPNPLRAANQGANNLWGAIQVAIFCNDQTKFAQCIDAYLNDPCAGIENSLPNGQVGDTGRDQGHAGGMIGNLTSVAEIAWAQGVDLYGVLDNRLLAISEYWCKYNSGENVEFIDHGTCYDYFTSIGSDNRDPRSPHVKGMLEKIVGAYVIRKNVRAPYSTAYLNGIGYDDDTFYFKKDDDYNSNASLSDLDDEEFRFNNVTRLISTDIGSVDEEGSSSYFNGTWTVNGSGNDINGRGSNDSFQYAYLEMNGDGAMMAKIESIENTDPSAKAAIVFRESLTSNSDMAAVYARAQDGYEFSSRGFSAADGSGTLSVSASSKPIWVKIERKGNNVAGFVGPDGVSWSPMQNTVFNGGGTYYLGLGVTAHNNNLVSTARFTNVKVSTGTVQPPPPPTATFTPDANKIYYIDNPRHNLRLASTGNSEDPYTTSMNNTGDNEKWKFVAKGNGSWHVQRAAGGTKPRLRSDNSASADMQETTSNGTFTYFDMQPTGAEDTYFFTLPNGPSDYRRLQISSDGNVNMVDASKNGSWESFRITEAASVSGGGSSIVHMTKRNASNFAIDGGQGGANLRNIYLNDENDGNVNQQWVEIDRGGGYYSYQKQGTEFCIDGNRGGANGQRAYLYTCSDDNQNQQWRKVAASGGTYRLEKRNSPSFSLDGNRGGENGQEIYLWETGDTNQNQQWFITPIGSASTALRAAIIENNEISILPNPVTTELTVRGVAGSAIEIYDLSGRSVMERPFAADLEVFDVSELRAGMYVVEIRKGEETISKKIVKQ